MHAVLCGAPLCKAYNVYWAPSLVKPSRGHQLSYQVRSAVRCYFNDELKVAT
jgi:hypothetical protein